MREVEALAARQGRPDPAPGPVIERHIPRLEHAVEAFGPAQAPRLGPFDDPDLCAVIVTYNSIKVINGLLDSLPAALGGLSCDVIVVDNGSTDGTADHLEARGGCRVIRAANTGYAGGVNAGVRAAMSAAAI